MKLMQKVFQPAFIQTFLQLIIQQKADLTLSKLFINVKRNQNLLAVGVFFILKV